jgi:two-component system chemotaxis sensor kinase CheA
MLLRVGRQQYLLPTAAIQRSFRPDESSLSTVAGRGELALLGGQWYPLFRLDRLFEVPGDAVEPRQGMVTVVETAGKRCALFVDELLGQQQVVIKSLGKLLPDVPGIAGGAILGDGRVGLILDAAGLVELAHGRRDLLSRAAGTPKGTAPFPAPRPRASAYATGFASAGDNRDAPNIPPPEPLQQGKAP